jgi:aminoglycoside 3-N-acetyltransferase
LGKIDIETRKRICLHVTLEDLVEGFRRVGVQRGDVVYCHSSLSRFGYVEGGAETVIDALLEVVGDEGTLAMPAGTYSLKREGSVFDVRSSPSELGAITEAFRRRATHRSHHLTESVCALGRLAKELTETHSATPCGAESPFRKFIYLDAQILLLGVPHNNNTTFEAIEEWIAPEYVRFREIKNAFIIDEDGVKKPLPTKVHDMPLPYDFNRMDLPLFRAGAQTQIVIGEAIVRRVSARKMYEVTRRAIEENTYALRLREGETRIRIPVSIHDLSLSPFTPQKGN